MPYKMIKIRNKDLYKVINTETGEVHSKGSTKENAKKQIRLLYMLDKEKGGFIGDVPSDINSDVREYIQDKGEETYGGEIKPKGRPKGSKNKVKKPPKAIIIEQKASPEYIKEVISTFEKPKSSTYTTSWRWILNKEKELQNKTYPELMKDASLKEFYYALMFNAKETNDPKKKLVMPTEEELKELKRAKNEYFGLGWLEKYYMDYRHQSSFARPQKQKVIEKKPLKKEESLPKNTITKFLKIDGKGLDFSKIFSDGRPIYLMLSDGDQMP